jgi:hypothetical protein
MSLLAVLAGSAASLAALRYLASTDPKRRRAFRLPPPKERHPRAAWTAVVASGALVATIAGAGGFFVWLGAVTVLGWAIAASRPERRPDRGHETFAAWTVRARDTVADWAVRARETLAARAASARETFAGWKVRAAASRPLTLEARVRRLEEEVSLLRLALASPRQPSQHLAERRLPPPEHDGARNDEPARASCGG